MFQILQKICFRDLLVGLCSPHLLSPGRAFHYSTQVCCLGLSYILPGLILFPASSLSQRLLSLDCICILLLFQGRVQAAQLGQWGKLKPAHGHQTLTSNRGIIHSRCNKCLLIKNWFLLINPQSNPRKSKLSSGGPFPKIQSAWR